MREQLANLKTLQQGPADKIANAVKEGDFGKAADELKKLQEQLKNDQLTDEQKAQLAKQLDQLQNKLQELADAHKEAKADLQQEIERRKKAGDLEGAGKLQRQLDQLNQLNNQMDRLRQMAAKMGQCQQCLQKGDCQGAAAELSQLADQLQELKSELEQLETLEDALRQIADAKEAMGCKECNGEGCAACMGAGFGKGKDGPPGFGLGEGRGQGDRPEEKTDTSFYESQVRGKIKPGEAVVAGTAAGPNRPGKSVEKVKDLIQSNLNKEADPLVDVRLPRKERQHAKEYFNRYNNGKGP
jgi:chemotaxis protein histidine kinase CheA